MQQGKARPLAVMYMTVQGRRHIAAEPDWELVLNQDAFLVGEVVPAVGG